jgi:hypothetical protein
MITGQSVEGLETKLENFEKQYLEGLTELEQVATRLPSNVNPLTKKTGRVKIKRKLSTAATNTINLMHEDTIVFKLNQKTNEGLSKTFEFLLSQAVKGNKKIKLKAIRVGDKQRRTKNIEQQNVFVDDAVIEVVIEGRDQPFLIGIDDKQYEQKIGKEYKYGRAGLVKRPAELAPEIIPFDKFETYIYLTANSYFYNRALFDRLLGQPGGGGVGELYQVINWIRGIYGLLPASPVDFSKYKSFDNIGEFVKQDTRMFVIMNDKLMTMTKFLGEVRKQALLGRKVGNTVTNLSRNFIQALSPFTKGRFLTGELKSNKKDFLRDQKAPSF